MFDTASLSLSLAHSLTHSLFIPCTCSHCSVADVNQSLIDDGLVSKEKISGTNYCWSFPGKADRLAQIQHQNTVQEVERLETILAQATAELADAKRGRQDDDDGNRAAKLARLAQLTKEKTALQTEYDRLKENDPQALADLEKELELVTQAAHRWTDNVFNCYTYLVKKRGMDKKQAVSITKKCISFFFRIANSDT